MFLAPQIASLVYYQVQSLFTMKQITLAFFLFFLACTPPQTTITESEVVQTIEGFFSAIDVDNANPDLMDQFVTEDFLIHEYGQKMNREEFKAFVSGSTAIQSDWTLSDFRITKDMNSAHASLFNEGVFLSERDSITIRRTVQWLESAFLVQEEDGLKIKFYFSDRISAVTDTLE